MCAARLRKVHAHVDVEAMGADGAGNLASSLPFIHISLVRRHTPEYTLHIPARRCTNSLCSAVSFTSPA